MLVNITIPVYNEEKMLPRSIPMLHEFLQWYISCTWEIVIVNNGSTDRTGEIAEHLVRRYSRTRVVHLMQRGRGLALKRVWSESEADILSYMDVDLSTNLLAFPVMIRVLITGDFDLVTGSRLQKSSRTARCLKREILSRGYNKIVRLMFETELSDFQCGFKAITARAARVLLPKIQDDSWFFDTELLLNAEHHGYRILDLPVEWVEGPDSQVKIIRTAVDDIKGLLRVRREFKQEDSERWNWKHDFRGWLR